MPKYKELSINVHVMPELLLHSMTNAKNKKLSKDNALHDTEKRKENNAVSTDDNQ